VNVLIVYAHPEPKSFTGALHATAIETLTRAGHEIVVSDLYAMAFNPVPGWHDFIDHDRQEYFGYEAEQRKATGGGTFALDIADEMRKVAWCDLMILQFPLWWYGLPAVLKGWIDRVFAAGFAYGGGRWFDQGAFVGKRAMLTLTTGGRESAYGIDGLQGDMDQILFPIHHGILHFTGFEVYDPFVAFGATYAEPESKDSILEEFSDRLRHLDTIPLASPPSLSDYDEEFRRIRIG
jgi:NAD(P)H dehydrogenase (quinone)